MVKVKIRRKLQSAIPRFPWIRLLRVWIPSCTTPWTLPRHPTVVSHAACYFPVPYLLWDGLWGGEGAVHVGACSAAAPGLPPLSRLMQPLLQNSAPSAVRNALGLSQGSGFEPDLFHDVPLNLSLAIWNDAMVYVSPLLQTRACSCSSPQVKSRLGISSKQWEFLPGELSTALRLLVASSTCMGVMILQSATQAVCNDSVF